MRNIIKYREIKRGYSPKLTVVRQNMDGMEMEFSDMLVEDQNNGTMPYTDCETLTFCAGLSTDVGDSLDCSV